MNNIAGYFLVEQAFSTDILPHFPMSVPSLLDRYIQTSYYYIKGTVKLFFRISKPGHIIRTDISHKKNRKFN